jgi:hypothetical protein
MRRGSGPAMPHALAARCRLRETKASRVWLLLIVVPLVVAAHVLGAFTLSATAHGVLASDQLASIVLGGVLLTVMVKMLAHVAGFGAGALRLRAFATRRRRAAAQRLQSTTSDDR